LRNEDLLKLVKNIKLSMVVIITASEKDVLADYKAKGSNP
jgi:hypothetical protein